MRIPHALILLLVSLLGCSKAPEVIDGPLTREILQRHMVDRGSIRYSGDDRYWKCEEVLSITRQTSTSATVEVHESGFKVRYEEKPWWNRYGKLSGSQRRIQYGETSRNSTYQLSRQSVDDFWRVDHCKWILKLKTGEYDDTSGPDNSTGSAKPLQPSHMSSELAEPQEGLSPAETNLASETDIGKLRADLASVEGEIESKQHLLFPDTVALKGGREINCEIIGETDSSLRIKTSVGIAALPRDRISSFTHATEAERKEALQTRLKINELETKRFDLSSRIDELQEPLQPERDAVRYIEARPIKAKADSRDGDWPKIEVKSVFDPTNLQNFIAILEIDNQRRLVKEGESFDSYTVLQLDGAEKCVTIIKSDSQEEKEFCMAR